MGWSVQRARSGRDALRSAALLAPAGEFSFVLLPLAGTIGILLSPAQASFALALAALTMVLGPVVAKGLEIALVRHAARRPAAEFDPDSFAMRPAAFWSSASDVSASSRRRCCSRRAST